MLTPEQFKDIGQQASKIYLNLELEIIEEIATRIANVGYVNTVALNDIKIAQEMGLLYQDIINLVAKYNNNSYEKIQKIFEDAGVKSIKYDDRIYKEAGLEPIPIKQSKGMLKLLLATAEKTNNNLNNLIMTTADTSQTTFYNVMNKAYMKVSTGIESYSTAIINSIEEVAKKGVTIKYPSGHESSVESAVRKNIVTGVNQTCGKLQLMRANELNWDLMEITAYAGARPSHAEWQGRIVSLSGKRGYLSFTDIGYGDVDGFKGINCSHDWNPHYEGMKRVYTDKKLQKMNNETIIYNGKEIKRYDAQQIQREMERQIRQDKKDLVALNGILRSNTTDNKLIENTKTRFATKTLYYNTHKNQLEDFVKQTNYRKDNTRLFIGNNEKSIRIETSKITQIANKYNTNIKGMQINDNLKVNIISEHIISKTYARSVKYESVLDTLKNPLGYGTIRKDKSQQIKGRYCTVVINIETGKLITVYPKKGKIT